MRTSKIAVNSTGKNTRRQLNITSKVKTLITASMTQAEGAAVDCASIVSFLTTAAWVPGRVCATASRYSKQLSAY
jgi:hypothetical protein